MEKESTTTKPPLGIMPLKIHKEGRLAELKAAITRYEKANIKIPLEWLLEIADIKRTSGSVVDLYTAEIEYCKHKREQYPHLSPQWSRYDSRIEAIQWCIDSLIR